MRLLHTTANACCVIIRVALGLEHAVCSVSCLAWQHRFTRERKCHGHGSSPQRANVLGCIRARGAWRGNGSARPVLKHGPESLACMQACGCVRLLCRTRVTDGMLLACQRCCSTCSGVAVARRTPVFRRHLRGRAKVTVFIEKKGFPTGRGSKSERATSGDPKVAGNTSENTVFARIAGIRAIRGI